MSDAPLLALPASSFAPSRANTALVLPTLGADALWAYAQQPEVAWAPGLAESAQNLRAQWQGYAQWAAQDWGQASLSEAECRVQCWGLVGSAPKERQGTPVLKAAALAQAWAGAYWQELPEGLFLVLRVHSPLFGVLAGSPDFLVRQQLEVQCLRQLGRALPELVGRVPGLKWADAVDVRWEGLWDESTAKMQRALSLSAVQTWASVRKAPAWDLQEVLALESLGAKAA